MRALLPAALTAALIVLGLTRPGAVPAVTVRIACSAVGLEQRLCRQGAESWAAGSGHRVELVQSPSGSSDRLALYQQWLAAGSDAVDVYQIDVVWPGTLGPHLLDLKPHLPPGEIAAHFPVTVAAHTVNGALKAVPWYADVGLLFYRKDLLARHGQAVPRTWRDLAAAARRIVSAERAGGNDRLHGYVFQGRPYEGLTCNALEWIASHGGAPILAADGTVRLDTPANRAALATAAGWVATIAPRGVLTYAEEEARGVFQAGHAVFMRNWPYAWALAQGADSPVRGKVGVAPLPRGEAPAGQTTEGTPRHAATLGGWGLAVSRYSRHPQAAAALVRHLTGRAEQARRAIAGAYLPTRPALYEDPAVLGAQPFLAALLPVLRNAVARPAAQAGARYNRLSATVWQAVHSALSGKATPRQALGNAERQLRRLARGGRW